MVVQRLGDFWRKKCTLQNGSSHFMALQKKKNVFFFPPFFHRICCFLACFSHRFFGWWRYHVGSSANATKLVSRSQAKNAPTGIHILPGTPRNQFLNGCVCVLFVNMSHVKILGHPTENVAVFKRMAVGFQVPGMHLNLSFWPCQHDLWYSKQLFFGVVSN